LFFFEERNEVYLERNCDEEQIYLLGIQFLWINKVSLAVNLEKNGFEVNRSANIITVIPKSRSFREKERQITFYFARWATRNLLQL
jgi:hypothetical protein